MTARVRQRSSHLRRGLGRRALALAAGGGVAAAGLVVAPGPALAATSPMLDRYPYLTDVTATSVRVTWATVGATGVADEAQTAGLLTWSTDATCTAWSPPVRASKTTFGPGYAGDTGHTYVQHVALASGLQPGTSYCYRIWTGTAAPVTDLLAGDTTVTTGFSTLPAPGSTAPFTFAVLGDWGENISGADTLSTFNPDQADLDARLASSGALFAVSSGDVAYPGGTQANYGDILHTGTAATGQNDVSTVFGRSYWPAVGSRTPLFGVLGNHGRTSTFVSTWPQGATVAGSAGAQYTASFPYAAVDGAPAQTAPADWYAFDVGATRFYVLDADWVDTPPTGAAVDGLLCDAPNAQKPTGQSAKCTKYQYDADVHWDPTTSAEYQWLAADLAAHPGGVKMAFFHFPLRSDNATERSDVYLQNSSVNPKAATSLEALLGKYQVSLAFNGHAHIYQRNIAPPGGVVSYVTGGGGGSLEPIYTGSCSPTDAYSRGWTPSATPTGSTCGSPSDAVPAGSKVKPAAAAQVYHFLKVTVNGTVVTVTPIDSTGATFDPVTYDFRADTVKPTVPAGPVVTATGSGASIKLTWPSASDDVGVHAYDIVRDGTVRGGTLQGGTLVASVPAGTLTFTDTTAPPGGHLWTVRARDLAGNTADYQSASQVPAPGAPTAVTAIRSATAGQVSLTWSPPATGAAGVTGYQVLRDGVPLTADQAGAASPFTDTTAVDGHTYTYAVVAWNGAVPSAPGASAPVAADWTAPSAPSGVTATPSGLADVALGWTAATDNSSSVATYVVTRTTSTPGVPSPVVTQVSGTATAWTDVAVPSGVYTYTVVAEDAAGNVSAAGTSRPVTAGAPPLLADTFESGSLNPSVWTTPPSGALGLVQPASPPGAHSGVWAVHEVNSPSWVSAPLPGGPYRAVHASAYVYVNAPRSTSAGFLKLRSATGAYIGYLYANASGLLSVRNDAGGVTHVSGTTVPLNQWVHVEYYLDTAPGGPITIKAALNGTPVTFSGANAVGATETLGANPIGRLTVGDDVASRTFDVLIDDVVVDTAPM